MAMRCRCCKYKMTSCDFIGYMSAELFLIFKQWLLTRSFLSGWNRIMASFSNRIEIPCPMCRKFDYWIPEDEMQTENASFKNEKLVTKENNVDTK